MKKVSLYVEPFAPAGLFLVVFSWEPCRSIAVLTSVFVHEMAHFTAMKMCGGALESIRITAFGINMGLSMPKTYAEECFVAAAGPIASFAYAWIGFVRGGAFGDEAYIFSLLLGLVNIIPIASFDGSRILRSIVASILGIDAAEKAVSAVSALFLLAIWVISVYVLFYSGVNFALLLFCAYIFIFTVIKKDCNFTDKMLQ